MTACTMGSLKINIFFLFIGLTLCPGSHSVKITLALDGFGIGSVYGDYLTSYYDWQLEPNQVVPIYATAYDERPRFAFVAHDRSKMTAEVTMATLFTLNEKQKSCEVDFSNPYDGSPIFKRLDILNGTHVEVRYTTAALTIDGGGGWMDEVDTSKCGTPAVIKSQPAAEPISKADYNRIHHFENTSYSAEDNLEPAEVNSTAGFIFTRKDNETDPNTSIVFANRATGETTVLDVISHASIKKTSQTYANGKSGLCLMEHPLILCSQKAWNGKIIMNYTNIRLPKKVDWYGVHNLKAPAILVITTDCPKGICREFKIRKLEEGDKVSKEVNANGFQIYCKDPASNLKMDVTDVANYDHICFNYFCIGNDYDNRRVFQYRRHCIKRDYFESK